MEIRGESFPDRDGRRPVVAPDRQAARAQPQSQPQPRVRPRLHPQPYEGAWRFTAPVRESSVPQARRAVRDLVRRRRAPVSDELLHGLLLILSELVTNAVKHAALLSAEIGVEVSIGADWVRVGVEDGHPYRPAALAADPARERTGGRGLLLVKALVAEAGGICEVEQTASGGKVVRAALPLRPLPPSLSSPDRRPY